MDVLCTFKIKIESQNLEYVCTKDQYFGIGIGIYSIIKYGGSKGLKNIIMVGSSREGTQIIMYKSIELLVAHINNRCVSFQNV